MREQQFLQDSNNFQQNNEQDLIKEKIIDAKSGCTALCCFLLFLLAEIVCFFFITVNFNSNILS